MEAPSIDGLISVSEVGRRGCVAGSNDPKFSIKGLNLSHFAILLEQLALGSQLNVNKSNRIIFVVTYFDDVSLHI